MKRTRYFLILFLTLPLVIAFGCSSPKFCYTQVIKEPRNINEIHLDIADGKQSIYVVDTIWLSSPYVVVPLGQLNPLIYDGDLHSLKSILAQPEVNMGKLMDCPDFFLTDNYRDLLIEFSIASKRKRSLFPIGATESIYDGRSTIEPIDTIGDFAIVKYNMSKECFVTLIEGNLYNDMLNFCQDCILKPLVPFSDPHAFYCLLFPFDMSHKLKDQ